MTASAGDLDLTLRRTDASPTRTIGRLFAGDTFLCWTLEDPIRDGPKIAHETAIPVGRYPVTITKSQREVCLDQCAEFRNREPFRRSR